MNKLLFLLVLLLIPISSQGMTSETYKINADEIGIGGGAASSLNYKAFDTLGESVIGKSQSESFKENSGFANMTNYSLSLVVDSSTKDLGVVVPGNSATGQSNLTVTTDAWGGYDLFISENHALLHPDAVTTIPDFSCSINSPCVWSGSGFGFTILSGSGVDAKWGTDPNFNYAAVPLVSSVFHTKSGYTSGEDQTVIGYRVLPQAGQKGGPYSNIITYTAVAKL